MADAAGIGLACGNCLVGIFQQWWYTKHFGASGLPYASEIPAQCLRAPCGFDEPDGKDADSVYERFAAATEEEWEAYLRGQPLPQRPMSLPEPQAGAEGKEGRDGAAGGGGGETEKEGGGGGEGRPGLEKWPSDIRPALQLLTRLPEDLTGRIAPVVRKGAAIAQDRMDVARRMRGEIERNEEPQVGVVQGEAGGQVVRRDVVAPPQPSSGQGQEEKEVEREVDVTDAPSSELDTHDANQTEASRPTTWHDPPSQAAHSDRSHSPTPTHTIPTTQNPTDSSSDAGPSREPAAWTIHPSVIPPRPASPHTPAPEPSDARLSGETMEGTVQEPESPRNRKMGVPMIIEVEDPLLPSSESSQPLAAQAQAEPENRPSGSNPTPVAEQPVTTGQQPVPSQSSANPSSQPQPAAVAATPRLPILNVPLPFLRPVTAPLSAAGNRLRPALGVLDQAKGGRAGSRDSVIERETEPGVYRRLADA